MERNEIKWKETNIYLMEWSGITENQSNGSETEAKSFSNNFILYIHIPGFYVYTILFQDFIFYIPGHLKPSHKINKAEYYH